MIFISILTLIVAKALPSLYSNISSTYFTRISAIVFLYAGVLSFNTFYIQSIGSGIGLYSGLFQITQLSVFIEVFFNVIGGLILIAWPIYNYNKDTNPTAAILLNKDYSLIVLFSTLGSCLLISSSDLISMYLSIELQSFGLYVLSTLYRDSESSTSAGLKYFLLGGLSSCLILLGAGIIYSISGLTNLSAIYSLVICNNSLAFGGVGIGLSLGLLIIIIGFLFKIAAAPLHNWAPDVYDDTPTIVTIWLTIMPKIAIIIILLSLLELGRISGVVTPSGQSLVLDINIYSDISNFLLVNNLYLIKNLLLITSLLSLIIGTVVGLAQTRIKRLLAYSTISHVGFILLALSINTEQSIESLIFYIIQYTLTNLNIFLILIGLSYIMAIRNNNIINKEGNYLSDIKYISDLKGQFLVNPLLSLSLCICLFSMAGIPPLIGFFSKQFVLYSAIESGYYFISFIAILVSVVSASYYLKIIKVLFLNKETLQTPHSISIYTNKSDIILTNFHSFVISTLTLFILLFILKPSIILNITSLISLSLFNF